jgi:hypothetical protein
MVIDDKANQRNTRREFDPGKTETGDSRLINVLPLKSGN